MRHLLDQVARRRVAVLPLIVFAWGALAVASLVTGEQADTARQPNTAQIFPAPLGRFLLVASEGLYVMEANGKPSWSYQPAPQGKQEFDDIIYDGWPLSNGHFLFSTHRYIREVDRDKHTVWEYRVKAPTEVKSGVPLPNGHVAALNSQEQAILEIEPSTGKILHRTPVPAQGDDHTKYMLMRRTPEGNFLVALRNEGRIVEVAPSGKLIHSFLTPIDAEMAASAAGDPTAVSKMTPMPVMALRLSDGSTIGTGFFGVVKLDKDWRITWWFTHADARPRFPLLFTWGANELANGRLAVTNTDWHLAKKDQNTIQMFVVDPRKDISWMLPASSYDGWKLSETEPTTGLVEHRTVVMQPMPASSNQ